MEYEYLFTKSLFEKLKDRIKAKVFCKVYDNVLAIEINTREGVQYRKYIPDFAAEIGNGLNADMVSDDVVREYKKVVLQHYFH